MVNAVNEQHITRRLQIIKNTLSQMQTTAPQSSMIGILTESFLKMIQSYTSDAEHFLKTGDYINAFAAVNYLWGWIDCGAELGMFTGTGEERQLLKLVDISSEPGVKITDEKINHYMTVTRRAMIKMKDTCPVRTLAIVIAARFSEVIDECYAESSELYANKEYRRAFATVNYTHAWIDAAARIGLYDVDGDDQLFTLFS